MTRYTIREVQTKKDLRKFIRFPFELYKGCDQYVPPLIKGQEHELMHAASRSIRNGESGKTDPLKVRLVPGQSVDTQNLIKI